MKEQRLYVVSRNPFQGGVGFSTIMFSSWAGKDLDKSQSLSGWGGVFNYWLFAIERDQEKTSQSLSGWGGVFNYWERR